MKRVWSLFLFVFTLFLFSCRTQQTVANYVEDVSADTSGKEIRVPQLRIQKNDVLTIQVFSSSTQPELSDAPYNLPAAPSGGSASGGASTQPGFLVDANGNIEYPRLGTIHVEGLTRDELSAEIKKRLTQPVELLRNPTVLIRFQSLKITVLGEVNSQGVLSIPGERLTILEAMGLAGGITEFGVKNSVKIIREADGKREIGTIDLSSKELFESPYYHLRPNDVVMVAPTKRKAKKADQDLVVQRVSFGLSLLTAFALIYNLFQ
jgi:polysaccharide biosynthesis/export protein